jgi:phenylacetate-CoA ligase
VTKVRGLFVHPGQADEVASRHDAIAKVQIVVTRRDHKDEMIFRVELQEGTSPVEPLKEEIEKSIRDVMKVRGEVQFIPRGTIPAGAKKIDDQRTWE